MKFFTRFPVCFLLSLILSIGAASAAHGADAASFTPVPVHVEAKAIGGGVPVGGIVAWPVAMNPPDAEFWLECNGQSTSGYPELAAIIGANVPDLRGKFLRGLGGSSAGLGATQGDAIRNITGTFNGNPHDFSGAFSQGNNSKSIDGGNWPMVVVKFDASRQVPTANENRPINMAVRYLIRARP